MKTEIAPFDEADYLDNDEVIRDYLHEAFCTGDSRHFIRALGVVIRANADSASN